MSKNTKDVKEGVEIKEVVKTPEIDTTNPFNKGVTYELFLSNVKGKITVDDLLEMHDIKGDAKEWIKKELKIYNNK